MSILDGFWAGYDATLQRVRTNRPQTLAALAAILNDFQAPSSGVAFFGNNADEHLSDALQEVGWDVIYLEGDYLWEARNSASRWHRPDDTAASPDRKVRIRTARMALTSVSGSHGGPPVARPISRFR